MAGQGDSIRRADDALRPHVQDVGVDLSGAHVVVPEEFLHGSDVRTGDQHVGGAGMTQSVIVMPIDRVKPKSTITRIHSVDRKLRLFGIMADAWPKASLSGWVMERAS
jgi:hypothetical protein